MFIINEFLIIILIFIIIIFFLRKYFFRRLENFNSDCNAFYKNKSFCQFNPTKNKCECYFQKDNINKPFRSPENCCKRTCGDLNEEECNLNRKEFEQYFYCNINGECNKYKGTSLSNKISENNCGLSRLTKNLILPYESKEQCEKDNNECKKYNLTGKSTAYNKKKCLENSNCGFCTNDFGDGLCMEGNASGPLDLLKYGEICKLGKNYEFKNIDFFENKNVPHCSIGGKCIEAINNNCGTNKLNNQINLVFKNYEDCVKKSLVCDKYNDKDIPDYINKKNCLDNVNCGYCNNNKKCVSGSPQGPNNIVKNYKCIPNMTYEYGDHEEYII